MVPFIINWYLYFKSKSFCEQAVCHTLGFIQNMGYPKESFLTWVGGGGDYWRSCVKFADGRVGVTVRRLVGIDATFSVRTHLLTLL